VCIIKLAVISLETFQLHEVSGLNGGKRGDPPVHYTGGTKVRYL